MTVPTEFFDALLSCEIALWDRLDQAVQSADGVSLGRLRALQVVQRHDGCARVNDVSSELRITVGAASKLIDRLEGDGTVRRRPNPDDRRSSLIALTPAGTALVQSASAALTHALAHALPVHVVADHELLALTATLTRLLQQLDATDQPLSPPDPH